MGLAASQARLLSLTSRIHDVEFEAQQIQYAKLRLSMMEDEVSKKYMDALDAETLTIPDASGNRIKATFDNLCGLGSINGNFGKNHYFFYDKENHLIVPSDVYSGFQNYGGSDPYEFAMYMMGIDSLDTEDGRSEYQQKVAEYAGSTSNEKLKNVSSELENMLEDVYKYTSRYDSDMANEANGTVSEGSSFKNFVEQFKIALSAGDESSIASFFPDSIIPDDVKEKIENNDQNDIKTKYQEYEYNLYRRGGGAEEIYNAMNGEGDFDSSKFNYYVRWGQMIIREGGGLDDNNNLRGCISANYAEGIEDNAELLNQSLMYGYLSIDVVYEDGKGGLTQDLASLSTDTYVYYEKTEKVDSTAVKKAEAEYNKKLKEINRIDKNYDLSLNRLETERTALTTEYDSVKKVISDNIERTFGIFS